MRLETKNGYVNAAFGPQTVVEILKEDGGRYRIRTCDPVRVMHVL